MTCPKSVAKPDNITRWPYRRNYEDPPPRGCPTTQHYDEDSQLGKPWAMVPRVSLSHLTDIIYLPMCHSSSPQHWDVSALSCG